MLYNNNIQQRYKLYRHYKKYDEMIFSMASMLKGLFFVSYVVIKLMVGIISYAEYN